MLFTVLCFIGLAAQSAPGFSDLAARAAAARDANDLPRAVELYREALQENPNWAEGWWYLGSIGYDTDQYAAGKDALSHVIKLDPQATPAWALLGLCEFETGDYPASLEHIQHALAKGSIEPKMEGVLRYHAAMLLTKTGDFDKAITAYVWFARRGVDNPELISAIGQAALRAPMLPKELKPADSQLYLAAGRAAYLSMSGQFEAAADALTQLVARYPQAHYVHYLYGCFLLAVNPQLALEELKRELEVTPGNGAASSMIALAVLQQGNAGEAESYAEAALKDSPGSAIAQYVLGRCLLEQDRDTDAVEHLKIAEERDPGNLDVHVSLAAAYSRAARPKEARIERLRSLELWKAKEAVANP